MKFTGERYVPGAADNEENFQRRMYIEHLSRYQFAAQFARGKRVLDLGCGAGYGSEYLMTQGAAEVTAVDISEEAVAFARARYARRDLRFEVADATRLTGIPGPYDLIVCFEMIEHVEEPLPLLEGAAARLAEDGLFLVSTPRKLEEMRSAFHLHEFELEEFSGCLRRHFSAVEILVHNPVLGYHLSQPGIATEAPLLRLADPPSLETADVFVAVCSPAKEQCSSIVPSLHLDSATYVDYLEREREILKRDDAILRGMIADLEARLAEAPTLRERVEHLEKELAAERERNRALAQKFQDVLEEKQRDLATLRDGVARIERAAMAEIATRDRRIQALDQQLSQLHGCR